MKKIIAMGLVSVFAVASQAAVVEYWDFEDGVDGASFTPAGDPGGSGGSVGVNGTVMHGWNDIAGPSWTSDTSPNGGNLGMYAANQDGYVFEADANNQLASWTSSDWTLELSVRIDEVTPTWETFVARMGSSFAVNESDFYFQRKGMDNNELRLNFMPAGSTDNVERIIVDGTTALNAGQWYGLAAVADSTAGTISLYVDAGTGYALDGQATGLTGDLGVYASALDWGFFRDYYNGGFDTTTGVMDNIRFSDTALDSSELIAVIPEPATLGLIAAFGSGILFIRRLFMI